MWDAFKIFKAHYSLNTDLTDSRVRIISSDDAPEPLYA